MAARDLALAESEVRSQIKYLRREMRSRGYFGKYGIGSRFNEFLEEARLFGFEFPNRGDGASQLSYYEAFDKDRLPTHVTDYFDILFCVVKLRHRKRFLKRQRKWLVEEMRRESQTNLFHALGLSKARHCLQTSFLRRGSQEVPTNLSGARAPQPHVSHADTPAAAAAAEDLQAHAEIQSEAGHSDLECPICMDADVEVQVQECKHKMCRSCAMAVFSMPHPHCPFCRGHNYRFGPIPHSAQS